MALGAPSRPMGGAPRHRVESLGDVRGVRRRLRGTRHTLRGRRSRHRGRRRGSRRRRINRRMRRRRTKRREGGGGEEARRDDGGAELRPRVGADAARVRLDELGPARRRAAGVRPGGHRRRRGDDSVPSSAPGSPKGPSERDEPADDLGSPTSKSIRSVTSDDASTIVDALTDLRYGEHMVFLVHGYAGSLQDLRLLRAHLQVACPNVHTRVSAANHERTGVDSIEAMGARLAEEVAEVMEDLESGALVPRGAGGSPGRPSRRRRRRRRGSEPRRGYPSPRTPSAFSSSARR